MEEEKTKDQLKKEAFDALRAAESAMHKYAASLELDEGREKAFCCFENIRLAWRNA